MMTIDFARNVLGLAGANSTEFDPSTPHPVIDLMDAQRDVTDMGGTMRLGAYVARCAGVRRWPPGLRHHGRLRAPPPPLRVQPTLPGRFEEPGCGVLGHVARRPAGRVHRARRPPVLGRHPGPPRVQEPPEPAAPLFRSSSAPPLERAEGRTRTCSLDADVARRSRDRRRGSPKVSEADVVAERRHRSGGRPRRRSWVPTGASSSGRRPPPGRGGGRPAARRRRSRSCGSTGSPSTPGARDPGRHARRRRRGRPRCRRQRELAEEIGLRPGALEHLGRPTTRPGSPTRRRSCSSPASSPR